MSNGAALHNHGSLADLLPAISAFARVAHHASFTRAARELQVSPSALSQTLRTLKSRLGVRLLERSTRRVGVTEIGRRFLLEAQPALGLLASAVEGINEVRDKPTGLLRLNLSRTAARILVLPHLTEFNQRYPDITLELHCDNDLLDLVGGNFDAGIRLGEFLNQDVVAVPLGGPQRMITVAAPSYLEGREPPRTPEDLAGHRCINARLNGTIYRWEYSHQGREFDIETSGPLISNHDDILLEATLAGAGIACNFEATVRPFLDGGQLLPLLQDWWSDFPGFYIYYSSRVHLPRKLRVFIDFMRDRLG